MMPPTAVHFNGGVNLADTETVIREIASRVPKGVTRIPDGETGDRQNWIWFQLDKFLQTPGLESDKPVDMAVESTEYVQMPKVRLTVDADEIEWPNLGYADVYQDSFAIFEGCRAMGSSRRGCGSRSSTRRRWRRSMPGWSRPTRTVSSRRMRRRCSAI